MSDACRRSSPVSVRPTAVKPLDEADYLFSEHRKNAYRFFTAALRWVIAVGVLLALFFFGKVASAF